MGRCYFICIRWTLKVKICVDWSKFLRLKRMLRLLVKVRSTLFKALTKTTTSCKRLLTGSCLFPSAFINYSEMTLNQRCCAGWWMYAWVWIYGCVCAVRYGGELLNGRGGQPVWRSAGHRLAPTHRMTLLVRTPFHPCPSSSAERTTLTSNYGRFKGFEKFAAAAGGELRLERANICDSSSAIVCL